MEVDEPYHPNKTCRKVLSPIWHRKRYTDYPLWCYTESCMLQMIRLQQHISFDTAKTDCECAIRWPERGVDAYCLADPSIASSVQTQDFETLSSSRSHCDHYLNDNFRTWRLESSGRACPPNTLNRVPNSLSIKHLDSVFDLGDASCVKYSVGQSGVG